MMFCSIGPVKAFITRLSKVTRRGIPESARARSHCRQAHRRRREDQTDTIIPDTSKEKPQEGEVLAVGPGARDESGELVPLDLKAGDRLLSGK